jgi:hypothetical protein
MAHRVTSAATRSEADIQRAALTKPIDEDRPTSATGPVP